MRASLLKNQTSKSAQSGQISMLSSHVDLSQELQDADQRSSQDSLPLSQETFQTLVSGLFQMGNGTESLKNVTDLSRTLGDNLFSHEKLELPQLGSNHAPAPLPITIPAVSEWSGDFGFKVFFDEKEPLSKKVNWTYSATLNRLYVKKDQMCPVNFATNCPTGDGYYIRAMLVYSEPQYTTEIVKRCVTHSIQEIGAEVIEAEHLIRSGSSEAYYNFDDRTGRHSVCVPFEDHTAGQDFTSYLFQFVCFNSCPGGPNRRQMTIVFTLEKINIINTLEVVGRKSFGLKVCACPGRDRITDEEHNLKASPGPPPKKKFKESHVVPSNVLSSKSNSSRKMQREYIIKVKDEEKYKFLLEMKKVKDEENYKFLLEMKKVTHIGTRAFLMHMKNCRDLYRMSKDQQNFVPVLNAYVNYVSSSNTDDKSEDERM